MQIASNARRSAQFLVLAATFWAFSLSGGGTRQQSLSPLHVHADRLQQNLEKLSEFGRNPDGGVTRLGFSDADLAAHKYVIGLMQDAGLEVRTDPAGNIFGHRAGSEH